MADSKETSVSEAIRKNPSLQFPLEEAEQREVVDQVNKNKAKARAKTQPPILVIYIESGKKF